MNFKKIEQFNKEVIGVNAQTGPLGEEERKWFEGAIKEEMKEFSDAHDAKDFVGQIDAVIDLIYFAGGALTRMGIPAEAAQEMFNAIHDCNMAKRGGRKEEREVQYDQDAVKPLGWQGPEEVIAIILEDYKGAK